MNRGLPTCAVELRNNVSQRTDNFICYWQVSVIVILKDKKNLMDQNQFSSIIGGFPLVLFLDLALCKRGDC